MSTESRRRISSEKVPHVRVENQQGILERYEVDKLLGKGSFGKVYEITERKTGSKWACKKISKEKAGDPNIKLLERELSILKRVSHPHIICLKEVFETPKAVFLIMELCEEGSLHDVLTKAGPFGEASVKLIIKRLASAVGHLHKQDIVHRDLKLQNLLVGSNADDPTDRLFIKVTDFGLSIENDGVGYDNMMNEYCGTLNYMAPEIIGHKMYSEKCDIWSMGVIMYALFCGRLPFEARQESDLFQLILEANIRKRLKENEVWNSVSDKAKECMCRMFHKDPAHRLTASEVLGCSWITGEERESQNVLEILKQFHLTGDYGEASPLDTVSASGDSSSAESRNGSAGSGDADLVLPQRIPVQPDVAHNKKTSTTTRPPQLHANNNMKSKMQLTTNMNKQDTLSPTRVHGMPACKCNNPAGLNGQRTCTNKATEQCSAGLPQRLSAGKKC